MSKINYAVERAAFCSIRDKTFQKNVLLFFDEIRDQPAITYDLILNDFTTQSNSNDFLICIFGIF